MSKTSEGREPDADGFDPRIRIGGLCMLLPDTPNQRLHVLMPATHGNHLHHALFKWDMHTTNPRHVDLGSTVDLTSLGLGEESKPGSIPTDVVDIGDVSGKSIR